MSIIRKKIEHQDTPRMQLVSYIQAAQGDLMNIKRHPQGAVVFKAGRALGMLNRAQEILRGMPEGEWKTE